MPELLARLSAAALLFLLSAWLGTPAVIYAWPLSATIAAYAGAAYWLETKGKRNEATTGLTAVADSGAILFFAASILQIDQLGFLAIAPILYARQRYGSKLWLMAPCVAGLMFFAFASSRSTQPPPAFYVLVLATLALPFAIKEGQQTANPQLRFLERTPETAIDPDAFLLVRENFRKLKDSYRELEKTARHDRIMAELFSCRLPSGKSFHSRLAEKISVLSGAESVAFYLLSQIGNTMVVRATSGVSNPVIEDSSHAIDLGQATRQITDRVELATRAMLSDSERSRVATIILQRENSIIGMISVFHHDWDALAEAKRTIEEMTPVLTSLVAEQQRKDSSEKRLRELELLYETAVVGAGATDRRELTARIVGRAARILESDFVGGYLIENGQPVCVASVGNEMSVMRCLTFSQGSGFEGWLASGGPEMVVFNPHDDQRCRAEELLRLRIGGFILMPLQFSEQPFGFLLATARASGALDAADLMAMRAISGELSQAVCRIENPSQAAAGLVTSTLFQNLITGGQGSCLVFFELLKKGQLSEMCDPRAVAESLRAFSFRLRGKLIAGGAVCQRTGGDFVAFLPNATNEFASSWANDIAATASMIGIKTLTGRRTIPLAFRAKVAEIAKAQGGVEPSGAASSATEVSLPATEKAAPATS